eukprot:COSAG06_NODE_121_length_23085_cov_7.727791_7_plen_54_part_00
MNAAPVSSHMSTTSAWLLRLGVRVSCIVCSSVFFFTKSIGFRANRTMVIAMMN